MKPIKTLLLLLAVAATATSEAHDITTILDSDPSFSTFNNYLSTTRLADEINRGSSLTVCAIDNGAMSSLLSRQYTLSALKNILSLNIFTDYFDAKKLHQINDGSITTSTLFQANVKITNLRGGKVGFAPVGSDSMATFVKSIYTMPYNISVIEISNFLTSPEAETLVSAPANST